MGDSVNNFDNIRMMMSNLKNEKYAIVNPQLLELDEYVKSLYIKMLCTIIQYKNEPTEMQILYMKRILSGIKIDGTFEEYMKKALDISETDVQEFFSIVGASDIKYYFALDGLLLVSMGQTGHHSYEYLSEIIELLDILKSDLKYLCLVAKSVLQQQSSLFDEARALLNERVEKVDCAPYIKSYYAGNIGYKIDEKHYFAPNKELSKGIEYPTQFKERKVVFENLDIEICSEWNFEGCEQVVFKNCTIKGNEYPLKISLVSDLVIEDCIIKDFNNRFACIKSTNIHLANCKFYECGYTGENQWVTGGMFYAEQMNSNEIFIRNNKFVNCYVARMSGRLGRVATGVVMAGYISLKKFSIIDNEFIWCECKNTDKKEESSLFYGISTECMVEENNRCVGEVQKII